MSLVFLCLECLYGWSFPKHVCSLSLCWITHLLGLCVFCFRMKRNFMVAFPANEGTPKGHRIIEFGEDV